MSAPKWADGRVGTTTDQTREAQRKRTKESLISDKHSVVRFTSHVGDGNNRHLPFERIFRIERSAHCNRFASKRKEDKMASIARTHHRREHEYLQRIGAPRPSPLVHDFPLPSLAALARHLYRQNSFRAHYKTHAKYSSIYSASKLVNIYLTD